MLIIKNIVLTVLFLLVFTLTVPAYEGTYIDITVSGGLYRGGAVLLDILTDNEVNSFSVNWQKINVRFPALCTDKTCGLQAVLPADYELTGDYELIITADNATTYTKTLSIADKDYPKQALTVDPRFVNIPPNALERVKSETPVILNTINTFSTVKYWELPMQLPIHGKINSQFGVLRVFNGEPRNKHNGIDYAGAVGEPVKAAAKGRVVLTGNFYFSGKTIYIDHGQGLITTYMHMSKINVKTGDIVNAGDIVGLVGATGRVTGPHLHFGLYAQGVGVDPLTVLEQR